MKCRRLKFNGSGTWWHCLWCEECRKHRSIDAEIQRRIDAYSVALRPRVRSASRRWVPVAAVAAMAAVGIAIYARPAPVTQSRPETVARHAPTPVEEKVVPKPERIEETVVARTPRHDNPRRSVKAAVASRRDLDYLNEDRGLFASQWRVVPKHELSLAAYLNRPLPPMKDDFVAPPEVLLTATGTGAERAHLAAQLEAAYRQEANVVDLRLTKAVSFSSKYISLAEVCASLQSQTGVQIQAARNVADDNATLFISSRPAKEAMRSLTRLFGYVWRRSGKEGAYTYLLEQEMKDQLAEEKLRNEDLSTALAQVVDGAKKGIVEKDIVDGIARKQFGGLSIDEFQQLRTGKEVVLSSETGGARMLESDKALQIMENVGRLKEIGDNEYILTGGDGQFPSEFPGTVVKIGYQLSVLELGGIKANAQVQVVVRRPNGQPLLIPKSVMLASVPGAGEANPRNGEANADLARLPELGKSVKVEPSKRTFVSKEKDYPVQKWTESLSASATFAWSAAGNMLPPTDFTTSGDVWEAIHKATGLDVVADSFSRVFPARAASGSIFEVLNGYCDPMGIRWRFQEGTLYARSTTYAWQRLTEVPKRMTEHWKEARKRAPLTVRDLMAMASLTDRQLDSYLVGKKIFHYDGIAEWAFVARPWLGSDRQMWRKFLRYLATLPPQAVDAMVNKPYDISQWPDATYRRLLDECGPWPKGGSPAAVAIDYIPTEGFWWRPPADTTLGWDAIGVTAKTADELKAILTKRNVTLGERDIVHTGGHLKLVFFDANHRVLKQIGDGGEIMFINGN